MSTVLRQFPEQSRSGTQQTGYVDLPNQFEELHLTGQAADAVLTDVSNAIKFEVLYSANGTGSDEKVIQIEEWRGGTFVPKGGSVAVPRAIDVMFGPIPATGSIALRATFKDATTGVSKAIVVGATVIGLP